MSKKILSLVMVVLSVLLLAGCAGEPEPETTPTILPTFEMVGTEPETQPPVRITMPDYELTYSGELKDVIVVEEVPDQNGLKFTVKLSMGETHIFTLLYNSQEGDYVTVITDADGTKTPVAFLMEPIPEGLNDEDMNLFCTAQESVNEIVDSLVLK